MTSGFVVGEEAEVEEGPDPVLVVPTPDVIPCRPNTDTGDYMADESPSGS